MYHDNKKVSALPELTNEDLKTGDYVYVSDDNNKLWSRAIVRGVGKETIRAQHIATGTDKAYKIYNVRLERKG